MHEVIAPRGPALNDLLALVRGAVLAVRSPGFYDTAACAEVSGRMISHARRAAYEKAPLVGRIGMAYFEAETAADRARYYRDAAGWARALHEAYGPHGNPIDLLCSVLDELWPGGARPESIEGVPMFAGLVRLIEPGGQLRPHQDVLEWDAPRDCPAARELLAQLTANVYLRTDGAGGELELWDRGLDRHEYEDRRIPGTPALDRGRLPEPALRVVPQSGELILFNSARLHAVAPVREGTRVTASCFIGVRGLSAPLTYWS
jgi:hypothetical protein